MVLTEFPDLTWLKGQIEHQFANRQAWGGRILKEQGWPTVILNATSKRVNRENIRGPLSLFTNISGNSIIKVEGRTVNVNSDFFFLTNSDQHYNLEIDQKTEVTETFNIHFGTHFAAEAIATLTKSPTYLLEHQFDRPITSAGFYNRLYPRDEVVNRFINTIRSENKMSRIRLDEQLYQLLDHLLQKQGHLDAVKQNIPVLKSSTREEIIKRLLLSTDFIYTYYHLDLSLEELAQISCMSKFHFLRLFKVAFQKTPHQFITEIRLKRAKELLKARELNVHQIATRIGFENASSFSRLFYNQVGVYPTQFQYPAPSAGEPVPGV
jgi:AraC family transcriptional regulator